MGHERKVVLRETSNGACSPTRLEIQQRRAIALREEVNGLEAIVGIDAEAQDGGNFDGLIVPHRRLEFPGAESG